MKISLFGATFLVLILFCVPAQATHIQYVDVADVAGTSFEEADDTWSWTFDLTVDDMYLWEIPLGPSSSSSTPGTGSPDIATADYIGSYDPSSPLHYVYLHIDPNKTSGKPTSEYLQLQVNGVDVDDWSNPISLYDWGVPGGSLWDPYGIAASGYSIEVSLTALAGISSVNVSNVNLEGCFDAAPVPEPATMLLFGSGLVGLAGWSRRNRARKSH